MADMGSEAAVCNAEWLSGYLERDSSDWFDIQVRMNYANALRRLAETQIEQGDIESGR
jgi:hypothetical protein